MFSHTQKYQKKTSTRNLRLFYFAIIIFYLFLLFLGLKMAHFDQIWPFLRLQSKCFKTIAKNSAIKYSKIYGSSVIWFSMVVAVHLQIKIAKHVQFSWKNVQFRLFSHFSPIWITVSPQQVGSSFVEESNPKLSAPKQEIN